MLSNGFIKLSIIAFYRRISVINRNTTLDIATKVLALIVFLWSITFFLIYIFACGGHVTAHWGSLVEQSKYCDTIGCTSEEGFAVSDMIINVFEITPPLPLVRSSKAITPKAYVISNKHSQVWALCMTTVRKLGVSCVLLLGATYVTSSFRRCQRYRYSTKEPLPHLSPALSFTSKSSMPQRLMYHWTQAVKSN